MSINFTTLPNTLKDKNNLLESGKEEFIRSITLLPLQGMV